MDNVYIFAAFVALVIGAWIAHSGIRRWQGRHPQPTMDPPVEVSRLTDFRWRPQLETFAGLLMVAWALRIFVLVMMQSLIPPPGSIRENPATGKIESLPTSTAALSAMSSMNKSTSSAVSNQP